MTAVALLAACGKKADSPKVKEDAKVVAPTIAPIATPAVIGIDSVRRMNFTWDAGRQSYDKAFAAYSKGKTRDWATIRAHTEAAVGKDPNHLDAQRLLATALAKTGDHAAAVEHFVAALAGDYFKYAASIPKDDDLKEFLATPHGASVREVSEKIKAEYKKHIASGLLVVARRINYAYPTKPGVEPSSSRAELYAYDRATKRYLRLTHTEHQVAGFVRTANEVVILGFDRIDRPKADDAPPVFVKAWIEILDAAEWTRIGQRISLNGGREISVGYGPGDQLLVTTAAPNGRWATGPPAVWSIDRTTGKLAKVANPPPVPRIILSLEEGRVLRSVDGIKATWTGDPPTAPNLTAGGATINIPLTDSTTQSTVALSPDKARIAFATAVDPCSDKASPSLYVASTKTGDPKHLLSSKSRFTTRWLDATTLAYEDGDGAIRLWDATTGKEAARLENKAGIALDVLSLSPGPLCKQAPPNPGAGSGSGSGDGAPPLPPEE